MPIVVTCPWCGVTLRVNQVVDSSGIVVCPKCGLGIDALKDAVHEDQSEPPPLPQSKPPPSRGDEVRPVRRPRQQQHDDRDSEEYEDDERPRRRRESGPSISALAILGCALVMLIVFGQIIYSSATKVAEDSGRPPPSGSWMLFLLLAPIFYLLPSLIAAIRGHRNANAICVLNLFLGCTFIGWVASLVWSMTSDD